MKKSGSTGRKPVSPFRKRMHVAWLMFLCVGLLAAAGFQASTPVETAAPAADNSTAVAKVAESTEGITLFEPFVSPEYNWIEKLALSLLVVVALAGLVYALTLVKQVMAADQGTKKMQEIAQAIREGANAYLYRQFSVVGVLIIIITGLLYYAAVLSNAPNSIAVGRALAFLVGSVFSATVGFVGMRLATVGNLRVAAAAKTSFGQALQLGYRTGTITGMLTDGLGLLGGSIIFLIYGQHAYEALLGFGFGGTLLALFMRVGGGIYTKAADVGADLVGKLEAGIPEDDPRNAATIADNVGDNVGDCAGMAADIFESYEVTIVAAMILGIASFGHKGVIFPLLVRAIGVIASIISTYSVKAGDKGSVGEAMKSVNRGFVIGSVLSIVGFVVLGLAYLRFDDTYVKLYPQAIDGFVLDKTFKDARTNAFEKTLADQRVAAKAANNEAALAILGEEGKLMKSWINPEYQKEFLATLQEKAKNTEKMAKETTDKEKAELLKKKAELLAAEVPFAEGLTKTLGNYEGKIIAEAQPTWTSLPFLQKWLPFLDLSGLDMRPAWTCLIGIILAVFLNKCTEYYTGTEFSPVKGLAKSCETGHATNIISGLAVGYESSVAAVIIIAAAIFASVMIYVGTPATFVAYGVAMCGIGMLTLTGNTISMDVFGPVADNANGIGEMGYDAKEMGEKKYKEARQILADLDAVGNTTKAITKGIAIGSAVIAAVSLFNSFIVSVGSGGQGESATITSGVYTAVANMLTISNPTLFIGMLIGGAVPFLFSSMTIRAVGRAAFLIVKECRLQFRDKEIWAGTKKPDYGRVVDICTGSAQKELIGPGLLAILVPLLVGFSLGSIALAGFLGGMIVTGQLLAVFMANAGGAWDNAKKMIEDEPKTATTGKGSEKHKAAITGDTVGDPLKDTAGPAINPLIKVMNMVSLLIIGLILPYDTEVIGKLADIGVTVNEKSRDGLFWGVIIVCVIGLAWAVWQSKRESKHND